MLCLEILSACVGFTSARYMKVGRNPRYRRLLKILARAGVEGLLPLEVQEKPLWPSRAGGERSKKRAYRVMGVWWAEALEGVTLRTLASTLSEKGASDMKRLHVMGSFYCWTEKLSGSMKGHSTVVRRLLPRPRAGILQSVFQLFQEVSGFSSVLQMSFPAFPQFHGIHHKFYGSWFFEIFFWCLHCPTLSLILWASFPYLFWISVLQTTFLKLSHDPWWSLICERLKSTVCVGRPCKPHCGVILAGPSHCYILTLSL